GIGTLAIQDNKWRLWPNPAKDILHLEYISNKHVTYEIVNLQGSRVMAGNVNTDQNVNIAALAPGMYFIRLSFDGKNGTTQKFVKH
ncbi:MAG: T9SS type A sorting domain-containing protein, partial [Flavipsychrobacter sp.]